MSGQTARTMERRCADVRARLRADVDLWAASNDQFGSPPHLVPLSFYWDGTAIVLATDPTTVTGRNLETTGRVRFALGTTRDVVLVDGIAESSPVHDIDPGVASAFAEKAGFDPRTDPDRYRYFRVVPERIQAWRNESEGQHPTVLRDGTWLG